MFTKKFFKDLVERSLWTFVQAFVGALVVFHDNLSDTLTAAALAGAVAVVKCLGATQIGAENTAATLPAESDTPDPVAEEDLEADHA